MRCSLRRPDPAQRGRLVEIRGNLLDRITEAEREGWLGEIEELRVSLTGAQSKINQIATTTNRGPVMLGMPTQRKEPQRHAFSWHRSSIYVWPGRAARRQR
ncbi:hypothetical protein [Streptomyces melanosporofaciens]|uniref:Uncharacterized protein n=1 Tax=Streptomyces melanosporofaciens TaxID=67327 RepID=A0A1H4KBW6_STRMJ|nr:hypothetical protein [Streptomyces melanosporofaciens]SEB56039.1 hypothetical protein SAMN04490356_0581 [Streptomyces melanosporofaciens]